MHAIRDLWCRTDTKISTTVIFERNKNLSKLSENTLTIHCCSMGISIVHVGIKHDFINWYKLILYTEPLLARSAETRMFLTSL